MNKKERDNLLEFAISRGLITFGCASGKPGGRSLTLARKAEIEKAGGKTCAIETKGRGKGRRGAKTVWYVDHTGDSSMRKKKSKSKAKAAKAAKATKAKATKAKATKAKAAKATKAPKYKIPMTKAEKSENAMRERNAREMAQMNSLEKAMIESKHQYTRKFFHRGRHSSPQWRKVSPYLETTKDALFIFVPSQDPDKNKSGTSGYLTTDKKQARGGEKIGAFYVVPTSDLWGDDEFLENYAKELDYNMRREGLKPEKFLKDTNFFAKKRKRK